MTDGGTTDSPTQATPPPALVRISADAAGDDRENLNDEFLMIENTGNEPLDVSGWTVRDEAGKSYTFRSGAIIDAGQRVTLHTGSGSDTPTDHYRGASSPVRNNAGDTVSVMPELITPGLTMLGQLRWWNS